MKSLKESLNSNDTIFIWNYKGTLVIADDMHEFLNYLVDKEKFDAEDDFDDMVSIEEECRVFSGKMSNISKEMQNTGYFLRNLK